MMNAMPMPMAARPNGSTTIMSETVQGVPGLNPCYLLSLREFNLMLWVEFDGVYLGNRDFCASCPVGMQEDTCVCVSEAYLITIFLTQQEMTFI